MTRQRKRGIALIYLFAVAGFLVWFGGEGWAVNGLPAHYLGYLLAALGVGAVFGLNIWYGGPLDPRDDPPDPPATDAEPHSWSTDLRKPQDPGLG